MRLTKQAVGPSTYEVKVGEASPDPNEDKTGIIKGKDGTEVLLLDRNGNPEKGPPDPEADRQRSHNWALVVAVVGSIASSALQAASLMAASSDQHIVSHRTRASIGHILPSPPEDADPNAQNAMPRLWVSGE